MYSENVKVLSEGEVIESISSMLHNELFIKLHEEHKKKNLFEIMGINYKEAVHNAFLSSLFAGDMGLESFAIECLYNLYHKKKGTVPRYACIKSVIVIPEYKVVGGRPDIYVEAKEEKILFIIENKVKTKEHDSQTVTYSEWVKSQERFKDYEIVRLLLTIYGEKADSPDFVSISYQDLFDEVLMPFYQHPNLMDEYKVILLHYFNNLTTPFSDEKTRPPMALVHRQECLELNSLYGNALKMLYDANNYTDNNIENNELDIYLNQIYKAFQSTFDEIFLSLDDYDSTPHNEMTYKKGEKFQILCAKGILKEGDIIVSKNGEVKGKICKGIGKYVGKMIIKILNDDGSDYLRIRDNQTIAGGSPSTAIEDYYEVKTGKRPSKNGMDEWTRNGKTLNQLFEEI